MRIAMVWYHFFALSLIFLICFTFLAVEGQQGSRDILDEYCKVNWQRDPVRCANYNAEGKETPIQQNTQPSTTNDLKCPKGTYYGRDNQGNPACRDLETNQLVDPNTGIKYNSQTGQPEFNLEQNSYIGLAVFIIIIIVGVIAAASRKKSSYSSQSNQYLPRRGWTEIEKEQVRIRQNGVCNKCGRPPPRWEYHHRDGNRSNDSLRNCEGLCPNCHSVKTHDE